MPTELPLRGVRALVSGAGVAGPALAYWLARFGATTTVVEIAPALRTTGFAVDFRGPTHLGVLARMGVLDELRERQTRAGAMRCVDERGATIFELPAEFAGGELEVLRSDLSAVLHRRGVTAGVEYVFGDAVAALHESADGVRVDLASGSSRTVDVVIGADGVHSGVRRVAFGPESRFVRHLGYYIAGWDMQTGTPTDLAMGPIPLQYNVPGRMASLSVDPHDPARATALCVFAAPAVEVGWNDIAGQREMITAAFTGMRWHVPAMLDALIGVPDLYFDAISRVRVPHWTAGRVALLGDAAWGVTLGGMGVGAGVVGGYVLAGELARAGGDHRVAFPAYHRRMQVLAGRWQRGASPGRFLAPRTAVGLHLRNALFARSAVQKMLVSGSTSIATDDGLPDYSAPTTDSVQT